MTNKIIYLDNNATTCVDERVLEEMLPYLKEEYANPSSMYDFATRPAKAIQTARKQVQEFLGAASEKEIIFTSCGSESANTAIKSALSNNKTKRHIITTAVEHPCVLNTYHYFEKQGYKADYIGVDSNGELNITELLDKITDETALVSIMWANNETGIIFPVEKIAEMIKEKNPHTLVYVDAVQVAGKININVKDTKIDMLGVSGHKFHAPKGVGVLYVKSGTVMSPLIIGGHQERGRRAGTENVPGIVGIGTATKRAIATMEERTAKEREMRDYLIKRVMEEIPYTKLNGHPTDRLPNNANFCFRFIEGESMLIRLDMAGICGSSGSACTSGSLDPSHVLLAIGLPHEIAHGSLRLTLNEEITKEDIDYVVDQLKTIVSDLRGMSPLYEDFAKKQNK